MDKKSKFHVSFSILLVGFLILSFLFDNIYLQLTFLILTLIYIIICFIKNPKLLKRDKTKVEYSDIEESLRKWNKN